MKPIRFFFMLFVILFLVTITIKAWADLTRSIAGNYKITVASPNGS